MVVGIEGLILSINPLTVFEGRGDELCVGLRNIKIRLSR